MLITADQLLCHAMGDYILQSHWMATQKTKQNFVAFAHAFAYGFPFLLLEPTPLAYLVIVVSHFLIDRYRLARFVVWSKNQVAPVEYRKSWKECEATGYPPDAPAWLSVWLLIIADNCIHIVINALALKYL